MKYEDAIYKAALERLNAYVSGHAMRASAVRDMVLEQVCRLPQPFTAAQLEEACKAERISTGTIYNALNLFIKAGMVARYDRSYGQTAVEYELTTEVSRSHMQVICTRCGRRAAFSDKAIQQVLAQRNYSNFNMHHFTLVVYGECKICRRLKIKKK